MKKTLTIGAILIAGLLLAGCTLQGNKSTINSDDTTMMKHDMDNMGNMDDMNKMGCCSQSGTDMSGGMMMMHNVKNEEEFIVNMIPHHQEAVNTAKIIVAKSTNPELVKLAKNIIEAQTKEIAMMEGWLKQWYPNSSVKSDYQNMMPALETLTGNELDKSFLNGMVMHHMGAIHMAQSVLKVDHRPETMTLANNIVTTQTQEIGVMKNILSNIR